MELTVTMSRRVVKGTEEGQERDEAGLDGLAGVGEARGQGSSVISQ